LPGVYCTVELKIPRKSSALIVPASAIIFYRDGKQVAVVENGIAHLHKITITTDYGTEVQVSEGVKRSSCNRRSISPSARAPVFTGDSKELWVGSFCSKGGPPSKHDICDASAPFGDFKWFCQQADALGEELCSRGAPSSAGSSSCGCVGIFDSS
jgi:hypothetical protein